MLIGETALTASARCDFVQDFQFHLGEVLDANLLDLSEAHWCRRRLGAQQLSLVNLPAAVIDSRQLKALADRDKSRWERSLVDPTIEEDPGKWSYSTIPFAATHVGDMPRLRIGVCARAARLLHGRDWTVYEEAKSAKTREVSVMQNGTGYAGPLDSALPTATTSGHP